MLILVGLGALVLLAVIAVLLSQIGDALERLVTHAEEDGE